MCVYTSILTSPWKDDYPEFHDMITKPLGQLEYVDEYNVPFWGGINHVLVKPHQHPLFGKETQETMLRNAHLMCRNSKTSYERHEHVIQETLDLFNKERLFWLDDSISEEWKAPLAKSAIRLPKNLYNQFKDSVRAVGNTASPVSNRKTVYVT